VGGKGRGGGRGGEMTQALYAHMNNKAIKKKKKMFLILCLRLECSVRTSIRSGTKGLHSVRFVSIVIYSWWLMNPLIIL
jgi:hypothetical protein